ncbi:MAG: putative polymerase chi subunit [Pseudomonadota bacterium]|jgi:DNA polymerase-3 subunit chi
MPRIEFHFNAPALVPYACRLLRKVHQHGLRAQVVGLPTTLAQLDQMLWTFSALDFLPHGGPSDSPAVRQASSILLTEQPVSDWPAAVLVNLGEGVPEGFEAFERVIEVVSVDELHRAQARERWRAYTAQGHALVRHDLAPAASA